MDLLILQDFLPFPFLSAGIGAAAAMRCRSKLFRVWHSVAVDIAVRHWHSAFRLVVLVSRGLFTCTLAGWMCVAEVTSFGLGY